MEKATFSNTKLQQIIPPNKCQRGLKAHKLDFCYYNICVPSHVSVTDAPYISCEAVKKRVHRKAIFSCWP